MRESFELNIEWALAESVLRNNHLVRDAHLHLLKLNFGNTLSIEVKYLLDGHVFCEHFVSICIPCCIVCKLLVVFSRLAVFNVYDVDSRFVICVIEVDV